MAQAPLQSPVGSTTRVLLVSSGDVTADHTLARGLRDTGAEVVLLPDAPDAAIVAAATQEAVDAVHCPSGRVASVTAAIRRAGLDATVSASAAVMQAGRQAP